MLKSNDFEWLWLLSWLIVGHISTLLFKSDFLGLQVYTTTFNNKTLFNFFQELNCD